MQPKRQALLVIVIVVVISVALQIGWRWRQAHHQDELGRHLAASVQAGDIEMLSTTDCVYCAHARVWFKRYAVPYVECNIDHDSACLARFQSLGAPGTPVLIVRGHPTLGFNPQQIAAQLAKIRGAPAAHPASAAPR